MGYKQGMNELLAVIMYLICTERGGLGGDGHLALLHGSTTNENQNQNQNRNQDKTFDSSSSSSSSWLS